jgi:hypothetical protein
MEGVENFRHIATSDVTRQAEAGARELIQRLEAINSSTRELPDPWVQPNDLQGFFEVLYADYVGRWTVIRP